jgi:hypothetical protein
VEAEPTSGLCHDVSPGRLAHGNVVPFRPRCIRPGKFDHAWSALKWLNIEGVARSNLLRPEEWISHCSDACLDGHRDGSRPAYPSNACAGYWPASICHATIDLRPTVRTRRQQSHRPHFLAESAHVTESFWWLDHALLDPGRNEASQKRPNCARDHQGIHWCRS